MPSNILKTKKDGVERIETTLDLKIITKITNNIYVVGDETGSALLETSQDLQEGTVYKILKPFFTNDTFQANPKFKILKTKKTLMTKSLTKKEFKKYQEMASEKKVTENIRTADLMNFDKCESFNENKPIETITVLIISKSRDIEGKYGKYSIVTAKDCEGKKNSLNIYHDKNGIVRIGKLLTFIMLKKTAFKPNDQEFHRLATSYQTRIFEAKEQEKNMFKNVFLGDEKSKVGILGYDNLNCYDSCKKCSSKLIEHFCKKCQKQNDEKTQDFYVTLYVQDAENEENIMNVFAFKKDLNVEFEEETEILKILDDLVGKTLTIEYNKPEVEDGRYKLVKLYKD